MRNLLLFITLFISACSQLKQTAIQQLTLPTQIEHNQQVYQLAEQADLGSLVRYFYLLPTQNLDNWQSAVELMLDRNPQQRTLPQRLALRERAFSNIGVPAFKVYQQQDFLYMYVIYAPNHQHNDWQIDIAKGRDLANCGFVQYQYSLKIAPQVRTKKMQTKTWINHLKQQIVMPELAKITNLNWHWNCRQ